MISHTLKVFIFSFVIGVSTVSCSTSDDIQITPPTKENIVDLSAPHIFLFSSRSIFQQSTFIEKAVTDKGTEQLETEWEELVKGKQPVSFTISNDNLEIYFTTGENKAFAISIIDNEIYIELKKGSPYLFAKLSKDHKTLTVVSSFFQIKGTTITTNKLIEESLDQYLPVGIHSYFIMYDYLKDIEGKYLQVAFEYNIKS